MTPFDTFVIVDWSGGNQGPARPKADAIWACVARGAEVMPPVYLRHRHAAEAWLADTIAADRAAGRRVLAGFDCPVGYPAGPFALWDWFEARVEDSPTANNRFALAGEINRRFGGQGPFWGNASRTDVVGLPRTKATYDNPFPERRAAEDRAKGAFPLWQLAGAGAVGSQAIMGLPVLNRLRRRFAPEVAVWPFEPLDVPVALVEVWPSLMVGPAPEGWIKDQWQVHEVARIMAALPAARLAEILDVSAPEEGWIFGLGFEAELRGTAPSLRNDCFALPPGVHWTPVDDALADLRARLSPVTGTEMCSVASAAGRVLAAPVKAARAHPPLPNTAVDGYGFAGGRPAGPHTLPLVAAVAAAGAAPDTFVPEGHAIRILTGAASPPGVDTVVLQEDVQVADGAVHLTGPIKPGANTRAGGEDVTEGQTLAEPGRRLTPADLGLLSATGVSDVAVRRPLRVAILSTGDELVEAGQSAAPGQIYDANRPMLLAQIAALGHQALDMGRVPDDRATLRATLDRAAAEADVILTSGGASAGDADHVSALLQDSGSMSLWRVAIKPGRPLALGMWQGTPVFGLPGNPVAALVCTLVFAAPALSVLAGGDWITPQGYDLPAGFEKRKKAGRREFLRARVRDGRVEVFASEGSGRISGLSWAEGLVELPDAALHVQPGDPVRYIPWSGFMGGSSGLR